MDRTSPLHILVVDDDPAVMSVLVDFLAYEGHTTVIAGDGLEGKEKFLDGEFDLVIVDQAMPKMNGEKLSAFIKQTKPDQPIIMLTGFYGAMKAKGMKPPTVDRLLGKPFGLDELRAVLAEVRGK